MNSPLRFSFDNKPVRIIEQDGVLWFCLADLGNVLDLTNHKNFLKSKACDSEGVCQIYTPTDGGNQEVTFISEPNMYAMTLRSDKEASAPFRRWVTHEVLPRIRKEGRYDLSPAAPQSNDPIIQTMTAMITLRQTQLNHEERLTALEAARAESAQAVLALPGGEARELTPREACREGIRQLVELAGMDFQHWWRKAYAEYDTITKSCVTKLAENRKMEKLAYVEKHGSMDMLLGIINRLKRKAAETATA